MHSKKDPTSSGETGGAGVIPCGSTTAAHQKNLGIHAHCFMYSSVQRAAADSIGTEAASTWGSPCPIVYAAGIQNTNTSGHINTADITETRFAVLWASGTGSDRKITHSAPLIILVTQDSRGLHQLCTGLCNELSTHSVLQRAPASLCISPTSPGLTS